MPSVYVSLCVHMLRSAWVAVGVCKVYTSKFTIITSQAVAVPGCKPPTMPSNIVNHQQHGTKRQKHDLFTEWNSWLVDSRLKLAPGLVDHYHGSYLFHLSLIFTEQGKWYFNWVYGQWSANRNHFSMKWNLNWISDKVLQFRTRYRSQGRHLPVCW